MINKLNIDIIFCNLSVILLLVLFYPYNKPTGQISLSLLLHNPNLRHYPSFSVTATMPWKPNTTVAAIAVKANRFLLVEEHIDGKTVFNQPAGHLEAGETLTDAVKREVLEETAWVFEPKYLVGVYLYPNPDKTQPTYLRFCFYGECSHWHDNQQLDEGIVRTVWRSREQLEALQGQLRSPMVTRCIDDYLTGQCYPLSLLHDAM